MKASDAEQRHQHLGSAETVPHDVGQEVGVVEGDPCVLFHDPRARVVATVSTASRSVASTNIAVARVLRILSSSASSSAFTRAPPRPTADAPLGGGLLGESEEGLLQVRRPFQAVQDDPMLCRELSDLLGRRVHGEPHVRTTVT